MTVKQLMNKDLVSVLPSSTIGEVAQKMKEHGVGSVLVVDEDWKLKGIVTDRDIAIAVAADYKDPKATLASEIMTADPIYICSDADFDAALKTMNQANVRRLPVTEDGKVVGLLSSADVAREIKDEFQQFIGLEEAFAKHCC